MCCLSPPCTTRFMRLTPTATATPTAGCCGRRTGRLLAFAEHRNTAARYHSGVGNLDVVPEEGMTGTPVIDPATGTLYVDAFTREVVPGVSTNYFHRIHALNITNGTEQPYSPVVVAASVPGTGVSGDNYTETQNGTTCGVFRRATMPASGADAGRRRFYMSPTAAMMTPILITAGCSVSTPPTLRSLITFSTPRPTPPPARLAATPAKARSGWAATDLCVDANTNLYFETGNGSFSAEHQRRRLRRQLCETFHHANGLAVADYFTPYNQLSLQNSDADLGSGGPLLLPDSVGSAAHPHLIVGCGQGGKNLSAGSRQHGALQRHRRHQRQ